ncbi:MAG: Response regulator receiver and ANTAR domain protein [Clostridia bacterium 62_21]|nr:MAG: Response regulator receiver and ANTAR domain protein [Clostridia bacterium 62_21]HAG07099.1 response regulator [Peptococcaceae bacterium]
MFKTRVLLATADETAARDLKDMLVKLGYLVVARTRNAGDTLRAAFEIHPDLALIDAGLPDYSGLGVLQILDEHRLMPVVILARDETDVLQHLVSAWVFGYLFIPCTEAEVRVAAETALANFRRAVALEQENRKLKKQLETRKVVERAKGLLMEKENLTESEAYKHLQKLSMNRSLPLARVAREIIEQFEDRQNRR